MIISLSRVVAGDKVVMDDFQPKNSPLKKKHQLFTTFSPKPTKISSKFQFFTKIFPKLGPVKGKMEVSPHFLYPPL
jgi:hypothetical protein